MRSEKLKRGHSPRRETASKRLRRGRAGVKDRLEEKHDDWGLCQEQIDSAVDMILLDKATTLIHSDDLRLFLYAKGILFDFGQASRLERYNILLDPDSSGLPSPAVEKFKKGRERLSRIVQKGEEGRDFQNGQANMFEMFVQRHPEWSSDSSFVVFRDHVQFSGKAHSYVERVKLSGLCYMHAPVVLQHYLVTMQRNDHVPMLDMGLYLRQVMSSDGLIKHIWDNQGGDSKVFLEHILLQDPEPVFSSHGSEADLRSNMERYGPALVQGFKVEATFGNSVQWQHLGSRIGHPIGLHAMVLVGHRKEGDDDRYLLQNWWKFKVFVEVDAKYLKTCGAMFHFVETPQHGMGSFPVNLHDHVECELLDAPESFSPETHRSGNLSSMCI